MLFVTPDVVFLLRGNQSEYKQACLTAEPQDLPAVFCEAQLSGSAEMPLPRTQVDPPRDPSITNTPVDPPSGQTIPNTAVDPLNVQPPMRQRLGEDLFRLVQVRRD